MHKFLNIIVNNYEVFCWEEDYSFSTAADADNLLEDEWNAEATDVQELPDEPEYEDTPSREVSVSYLNGETQKICGYDDLPDRVNELTLELFSLFEDEPTEG
jgi:argininosuccinate synthase